MVYYNILGIFIIRGVGGFIIRGSGLSFLAGCFVGKVIALGCVLQSRTRPRCGGGAMITFPDEVNNFKECARVSPDLRTLETYIQANCFEDIFFGNEIAAFLAL